MHTCHTYDMNRAERRKQPHSKSNLSKAGLTYLTVAGVVSGAVGFASPAHAAVYTSTDCSDLIGDLTALEADDGGTLTANFSGSCDLAEGYMFDGGITLIGPADGSLNLRFTGSDAFGFAFSEGSVHSVSNLNFTKSTDADLNAFIVLMESNALTVSNSTFSDASIEVAIYAEGNLIVSDSTFENLTSTYGGAAIYVASSNAETVIANSTFTNNQATGQASGGAVNARGVLTIANSTFDSNLAGDQGGAVFSENFTMINNSTFTGNSATTGAAVVFGEGGIISNSTFWNNGDADTSSIDAAESGLFGNILANDSSDTVKLFEPESAIIDLGANLYTDTSFADTTIGVGSSELVTSDQLNLSALYLNQTGPANTGTTETVSISTDSIAYDFYSADSPGIDPTSGEDTLLAPFDQRGVARPFGAGYLPDFQGVLRP